MCVGIVLALALLLLYYSDVVVSDMALSEQVGNQTVVIATGWEVAGQLWPLMLLAAVLGIMLLLIFLKMKKIL
ncbi:hypothetical protein [Hydrogenovibrio marinus]|nr:hypothetical protein [Hydrogenovibrio marinus]BBN58707.1 hypothetical protein HVMH_0301 [Hydrogenovibrio marinus]